jgi:CspA family cold shock protein
MATGIIKSWHSQRSFGFIKADDDTGDVFVHISGCAGGPLCVGDAVEYEAEPSRRHTGKLQAFNVRVLD